MPYRLGSLLERHPAPDNTVTWPFVAVVVKSASNVNTKLLLNRLQPTPATLVLPLLDTGSCSFRRRAACPIKRPKKKARVRCHEPRPQPPR